MLSSAPPFETHSTTLLAKACADWIIIEHSAPCDLTPESKELPMIVKMTTKNRLTLPKAILLSCPGAKYFDVSEDNGRIVLTPVHLNKADAVRSRLAQLGISESNIPGALQWAGEGG